MPTEKAGSEVPVVPVPVDQTATSNTLRKMLENVFLTVAAAVGTPAVLLLIQTIWQWDDITHRGIALRLTLIIPSLVFTMWTFARFGVDEIRDGMDLLHWRRAATDEAEKRLRAERQVEHWRTLYLAEREAHEGTKSLMGTYVSPSPGGKSADHLNAEKIILRWFEDGNISRGNMTRGRDAMSETSWDRAMKLLAAAGVAVKGGSGQNAPWVLREEYNAEGALTKIRGYSV